MRMMLGRLRSRDQQGAAAVIVIVSMFVLLGMLVLTMDVGGLLLKHRGLVNANDAAALAAAESFARGEAQLVSNEQPARDAADQLAHRNEQDAQREAAPADDPKYPAPDGFRADAGIDGSACDPAKCGTVTVWYAGHTSAFFAQIFGYGKDVTIHERAQAIWGPAKGGYPNPIMVRFDWMKNTNEQICDKPVPPPDDEINITCRFWLDDSGIGDAQWSFLNLIPWNDRSQSPPNQWGWDVPRYDSPPVFPGCSNVGDSTIRAWIEQTQSTGQLGSNYPDPTYVCRVAGHASAAFQSLKDQVGTFRVFPVNDPDGQVDKDGNLCPPPCTPAKYDIVGFTTLRIDQVLKGNDSAAIGIQPTFNNLCKPPITANFTTSPPSNTYDLDNQSQCSLLNLHYPGDTTKAYPRIRAASGNTEYAYGTAPGPGVDFTYDPTSHVITWVSTTTPSVSNARIDWEYDTPASPGACGVRNSNANAVCLLASWQGFQTGGINPCEDNCLDLGLRAVRLNQ